MTPFLSFSSATASLSGRRHGVGALHLLAELELVDHELLLGVERAVLDLVGHVDRELALLDLVAGKAAGVRRDRGHVDAGELQADVGVERRRQQVHLAVDGRGRVAVHLALEVELRARGLVGGEPDDAAVQLLDADARSSAGSRSPRS